MVLFPEPEGPTTPSIRPGSTLRSMSRRTRRLASPLGASVSSEATELSSAVGYRNDMFLIRTWPPAGMDSTASGASASGFGASSTSKTRSNDTKADSTSTRALVSWARGP